MRPTARPGRWDHGTASRYGAPVPQRSHGHDGGWQLNRRAFIGAGLAIPAAAWLAACSGDDTGGGDDTGNGNTSGGGGNLPGDATIIPRYPPDVAVPGTVRLPISFDSGGILLDTGPDTIQASIFDSAGTPVVEQLAVQRVKLDAQQTAFWAVRADIASPGIYDLRIDGVSEPQAFQVLDPAQVAAPKAGEALPPFDTPTVDDPRGVDPICTRAEGICPLHSITLTEALALGKPIAYLVSTPAHCQFGVCGPVLELLLAANGTYGDRVTMVHADVYADDTATKPAPAVEAYSMSWEPSIYIADATGTIVERLDITWSSDELDAALAKAGA
jgi:hypothetical protein